VKAHRLLGSAMVVLTIASMGTHARGGGGVRHPQGSHAHGGATRPIPLGAAGGGYGGGGFFYFASIGPYGAFMFGPPMGLMGPWAIPPAMANGPVPWGMAGGPIAPPPPPGWPDAPAPARAAKPATRQDPARSTQLVLMGDRLFRAGKFKNAEDRYSQAARLDIASAGPRIRLAQVALVREQYAEAAQRFREAETAQPGWIVTAPDIQGIYGEPSEFAGRLSRLESYLQAHPDDRDAWLVLGAEWYLSGRTARAADVFLRLNDPARKSDIALAAFLDASNQR
jgi:hypothetical protein